VKKIVALLYIMTSIVTVVLVVLVASVAATAHAGQLKLDGKFTQGGLIIGQTDPGAQVRFEGEKIRVSPEGIFVIGFNRDAKPTASLALTFADGSRRQETLKISQRNFKTQAIDGLPKAKVRPPKEVLARIKRETMMIVRARAPDTPEIHFLQGWRWPAIGPISGVYGSQRTLNGIPSRPHYGIDIAAPVGTEVVAPTSGIVRLAHKDMYFSGGTIIIDHGYGLTSAFLHLKSLSVKVGQRVTLGQRIGTIGATGRATGPHLDWRINLFKRRLDPGLLMHPMPPQN
jgi:murein DD-endopeptidase MepM/ murein hydrolase activator NlpD